MNNDLLLKATPDLLTGWCGPVLLLDEDRARGASTLTRSVWHGHAPDGEVVYLDLSRAECRDRVARVLARAWGMPAGDVSWYYDDCEDAWFLVGAGVNTSYLPDTDPRELGDIDPADDTRLADGSRRVDAMALLFVAREVLGE